MRLRWKGQHLRHGGRVAATIHGSDAEGWRWTAGNPALAVPNLGPCAMLVATEAEAKSAAARYVRSFMQARRTR